MKLNFLKSFSFHLTKRDALVRYCGFHKNKVIATWSEFNLAISTTFTHYNGTFHVESRDMKWDYYKLKTSVKNE